MSDWNTNFDELPEDNNIEVLVLFQGTYGPTTILAETPYARWLHAHFPTLAWANTPQVSDYFEKEVNDVS